MTIKDLMEKDFKRIDKLKNDYSSISYTGKNCINCGRDRVLKCTNGKKICEKCGYDQYLKKYNSEYLEVY